MPFLKAKCPECGKVAVADREFTTDDGMFAYMLKCGHAMLKASVDHSERVPEDIVSLDGKRLYPYQCDGVRFAESSGGRCLIADEMGLGKTVQFTSFLALHPELRPFVVICKAALKSQWQFETLRWLGEDSLVQVIDSAKEHILKGCAGYIFSFDSLRRFNGKLQDKFKQLGVKVIGIDEVQQIKNVESKRTQEVRALCADIDHVIALSGTPIKNNASEYFPILNILRPQLFPRYNSFIWNECQSYFDGYKMKIGGLRYPDAFKDKTKNFIIRRERKDVLPDLPTVTRNFHFSNLDRDLMAEYEEVFRQFEDEMDRPTSSTYSAFDKAGNILAYLSKMRHITGRAKVIPCVEFVGDFLEQTERKLTIFVHHKDVAKMLVERIEQIAYEKDGNICSTKVLSLSADLNSEQRGNVVKEFWSDSGPRVLVASTLASGEGLNLQCCSDCVMLERQWNPANEEQAEARFIRIGQLSDKVTANYMIAVSTVDEHFSNLVEQKREIVVQTLGGEAVKWDQSSLVKELSEILLRTGRRKWHY